MNTSTPIQSQLVATKFYIPVAPGRLISRPRLSVLLDKSFNHPFTLVSAPAGLAGFVSGAALVTVAFGLFAAGFAHP